MLVRAFFAGAGSRLPYGGVFGFLNLMTGALERVRPSHVLVAWDVSRDTFRRELYADYKGTRGELPDELLAQFALTQEVLSVLSVPQHKDERYEADDIIGAISRHASAADLDVLVLTGDKDALQLVSDRVSIAIMRRGITEVDLYTPQALADRYGLTPTQFIDLKALMGDTSDNIPGIRGVGEKTALKLLHQYGSMEAVLENTDQLTGKLRDRVREHRELAQLSKRLATIVTEFPLGFGVDECRLCLSIEAATEKLNELRLARFLEPLSRIAGAV